VPFVAKLRLEVLQFLFKHLAGAVLGEGVENHDVVRDKVGRQMLSTKLEDALCEPIGIRGPCDDKRLHRFAQNLVRHPDDGGFEHVVAFQDALLQLSAADSLAAAFQEILRAADDRDEPVRIDRREVPRVQ